jgi:hypothetical protein
MLSFSTIPQTLSKLLAGWQGFDAAVVAMATNVVKGFAGAAGVHSRADAWCICVCYSLVGRHMGAYTDIHDV